MRSAIRRAGSFGRVKLETRARRGHQCVERKPAERAGGCWGSLGVIVALGIRRSLAQWIAPYSVPVRSKACHDPAAVRDRARQRRRGAKVQGELQSLADRLAACSGYARRHGRTHWLSRRSKGQCLDDRRTGGVLRGLLTKIDNENALVMVMAHELAHLKYRHASAALGRGVAIGVICRSCRLSLAVTLQPAY